MDKPSILPEVEVKLLAPSAAPLRAISRLRQLGGFRIEPRSVDRLRTIYLDTPELILARHGVALRVRHNAGAWEATAKWGGSVHEGLHERPELNVALDGNPVLPFVLPEGPLRLHLTALVIGRPLNPILVTQVRRQALDVLAEPGESPLAELALDTVQQRAPQGERRLGNTYYEVEVEQRGASAAALAEVAALLQRRFPLSPSATSKFSRGLADLYEPGMLRPATPEPIRTGDTVEAATRKIFALQLLRLRVSDPGTRLGEDPEALHAMRVATRRMRAALRSFAAGIPASLHAKLHRDLEWLGQTLGQVRDLDVQVAHLAECRGGSAPKRARALDQYGRRLESERERCRAELLSALDSRRYFELLGRLERFALSPPRGRLRTPGANDLIGPVAARAIKRAFRRVLRQGDAASAAPQPDALHRLRISAKRLRYLLEFLAEIVGPGGQRLVERLEVQQDLLGAINDAVFAARLSGRYGSEPAGAGEHAAPRTLQELAETELMRAGMLCAKFQRAWRRFARKRTIKTYRAVIEQLRNGQ